MLTQTSVPGTDDWYLMQLAEQWGRDLPRLGQLRAYIDGTALLPQESTQSMRDAYRRFLRMHRLNVADLAVNARVNRMKPLGFRTAAADDDFGDALAMQIWKGSNLKVGSRDFFRTANTYGSAFLLNTGPTVPSADAQPLIVPKTPWEMTTIQNAAQPWLADAALMVGYDPINQADVLTLFRPGYMRQAFRSASVSAFPTNGRRWTPGRGWIWASEPVLLGFTQRVPVSRLDMADGKGVFEAHTDSLDRVNKITLDGATIIAMQAFRQLAIQGKLPRKYPEGHPQAGEDIDYESIYQAGPNALWMLPEGAKIWESSVTDVTPVLGWRKDEVRNFAAVTSTPLYILQPDATNGSAEGATLAREGLTFAVEELEDRADTTLAQSLSMGFEALGDQVRSAPGEIETIWAPVERASIQERSTAAQAAKQGGLSQRTINEKVFQLTPSELEQEDQRKQDEAFLEPAAG